MNKFKHLILTIVTLSSVTLTYGVPARPGIISKTLPDGSVISLNLRGDESHHQYFSVDGIPVFESADGFYYYAELMTDNTIKTSQVRVSEIGQRTDEELKFIATLDKDMMIASLNKTANRQQSKKHVPTPKRSSYPTIGEQHALVILVEYTDTKFTIKNPQEAFYNMMNQEGYNRNGATGSAKEYFEHVSSGQFNPTFDVYGPVTLAHEVAYYGGNTAYGDALPEEMIIEACQLVDADVDFSLYDNDNDGEIDNVYVFYAGEGEASGGSSSTVWPHSWDIYDVLGKRFMYDGLLLNHYACSNEIYLNEIEGIGTFCHEFSHVLGLPDEYSTSYTSSFVPGNYSTLCYGCYNNEARTPASYTLYQRYELGWVIPEEIGTPAQHSLKSIDNNHGYIMRTSNANEYFLLENRQQEGWDKYIPGHGMLIWHIDYDENVWYYNQPNDNPSHQYIDIEEADNIQTEESRDGDTFPGAANITTFTDETRPSSISWDYEYMNKPITEIREIDGVIYFQISGGIPLTKIDNVIISDITPVSFKIEWDSIDVADGYNISLYTKNNDTEIVYVEGYEKKDVGNITSFTISDLNPSTTYYFQITSYNKFQESEPTQEFSVTTSEATFDMKAPFALDATNITDTSFTANWTELEGSEKYFMNVYCKQRGEAETTIVDFTDGVKSLPEGFSTNTSASYASESYSGNAIPSLRMSNDRTYIETAKFDSDIRSFKFWHRGVGKSEGNEIAIYAYVNNEWIEFDRIQISNQEGGSVYEALDGEVFSKFQNECHAIKIEFIKVNSGSLAVDDIIINHGGSVIPQYVDGYQDLAVDTSLSAEVTNLSSNTFYYYTIYATKENIKSSLSNEILVKTTDNNTVGKIKINNQIIVKEINGMLQIQAPLGYKEGFVYNINGMLIGKFDISTGNAYVSLPAKGVYIISIGDDRTKIIR